MEGQIKTLRAQKKSSEKQLEQVKGSLDQLKAASEAAAEAYGAAKGRYDGASQLYLSAQAFLTANPDCKTSGGLAAAASYVAPPAPVAVPSGDSTQAAAVPEPSKEEQAVVKAALAKKEQALALQKALGEIGITVENLDETSINTLKDQMEQAQKASEAASTGYTQAAASVGQLEAAIAQVKAQIEALEDNIDAAEDAANAGGGTKAYDAQIKAAQTGVESAQYQKDLYTVTAPIGGVIESVNVTADEVSAQGMPAFIISDKEAMEVSFYVPEEVRDFLKNGDEVKVEASDGEVKGRVSLIGTAVDQQKGLFEIVAEITGVTDKSLLSNTSVSLSLVTNSVKGEILIPFDAVYYDNDQAYVFIAKKGSDATRAERRDVKTGVYNNEQISIVEGLTGGEEVITTWGAGLKDGAVVEILHPAAENKTGNTTGNTSGNKTAE
jgi:RND family efflux transporter MFP subunit